MCSIKTQFYLLLRNKNYPWTDFRIQVYCSFLCRRSWSSTGPCGSSPSLCCCCSDAVARQPCYHGDSTPRRRLWAGWSTRWWAKWGSQGSGRDSGTSSTIHSLRPPRLKYRITNQDCCLERHSWVFTLVETDTDTDTDTDSSPKE